MKFNFVLRFVTPNTTSNDHHILTQVVALRWLIWCRSYQWVARKPFKREMPNPKSEEREAQLPNPKSPNATCHANSTLAVSSSPSSLGINLILMCVSQFGRRSESLWKTVDMANPSQRFCEVCEIQLIFWCSVFVCVDFVLVLFMMTWIQVLIWCSVFSLAWPIWGLITLQPQHN